MFDKMEPKYLNIINDTLICTERRSRSGLLYHFSYSFDRVILYSSSSRSVWYGRGSVANVLRPVDVGRWE